MSKEHPVVWRFRGVEHHLTFKEAAGIAHTLTEAIDRAAVDSVSEPEAVSVPVGPPLKFSAPAGSFPEVEACSETASPGELTVLRDVATAAEKLVREIWDDNRTDEEQEELCRAVNSLRTWRASLTGGTLR